MTSYNEPADEEEDYDLPDEPPAEPGEDSLEDFSDETEYPEDTDYEDDEELEPAQAEPSGPPQWAEPLDPAMLAEERQREIENPMAMVAKDPKMMGALLVKLHTQIKHNSEAYQSRVREENLTRVHKGPAWGSTNSPSGSSSGGY